jgi:hypothetical protein
VRSGRWAWLLLGLLLLAARLEAQPSATATLSGTDCPGAGCLSLSLGGVGQGSANVSGTWVGELTFEAAPAPCTDYVAIPVTPTTNPATTAMSTTGNGGWFFNAGAYQCIRVRAVTLTSGAPRVTLFIGPTPTGATAAGAFAGLTAAQLDARLPLPTTAAVTLDTTGLATDTGQATTNTTLSAINGKLPALVTNRVPVTCDNCAGSGGGATGGLTDVELRASPLEVTGAFYPTTQPVSGTVAVGNFPSTQTVAGAVTVTNFPASTSVANFPASQTVAGTVTVTPPAITKGTQGTTGFTVQRLTDAGRAAVSLTLSTTAPTTADTVSTALVKNTNGVAAAGTTSIVATAGRTLRLMALNAQVRTTTAATPWALVTLRMSATTTCTASSSVVAYLGLGGTAAVIGNTGSLATQFPDGFELIAGGSFCLSISGNLTTNALTVSAQGFEY